MSTVNLAVHTSLFKVSFHTLDAEELAFGQF